MNCTDPNNREQEKKQPVTESVSVIIAVHNRFELLKNVVESALWQTHPVLEIILVDDGSTDGTAELLPKYIQENPRWRERVRYQYQENQGQSVAGNRGIAMAKGEWLAFNGSDDLWLPQKLECQFRALREHPDCGLCFTDAWFMNSVHMKTTLFQHAGVHYEKTMGAVDDVAELVRHLAQAWVQTVMARADLVNHVHGFDPELHYHEDQDFLFRMARVTRFCYVSIPMVLIDRTPRRHVGRAMDWAREDFRLSMLQQRIEKNLALSSDFPPEVRRILRKQLRCIYSEWVNWHLYNGKYEEASNAAAQALKCGVGVGVLTKWVVSRLVPGIAKHAASAWHKRREDRYYKYA